jgi:hypothetical protein
MRDMWAFVGQKGIKGRSTIEDVSSFKYNIVIKRVNLTTSYIFAFHYNYSLQQTGILGEMLWLQKVERV